ncbi:MAG TPA: hypothetical protein VMF30_13915, partial [Pirellulales bacterium]|nr:hypothetical protein [Pirellulales bacterium]
MNHSLDHDIATDAGCCDPIPGQIHLAAETKPTARGRIFSVWAICLLLVLAVGLVFGQTLHHQFVDYDDEVYVSHNPYVRSGLTWQGTEWAFSSGPFGEWYPLTVLSHMLDSELYGLEPGWHYLTNVLLHASSSVLLFLVLLRMTDHRAAPATDRRLAAPAGPSATPASVADSAKGSGVRVAPAGPSATTLWCSAWVAAVFAIHPLHVESVAWLAERRDMLSGLFFMLTLGAYTLWTERPSWARYLAVLVCLALGLMSKPMLVTVPFVLLLLDYWPLKRLAGVRAPWLVSSPVFWWRVAEKIPLVALSAASCGIVLATHAKFQAEMYVDQ